MKPNQLAIFFFLFCTSFLSYSNNIDLNNEAYALLQVAKSIYSEYPDSALYIIKKAKSKSAKPEDRRLLAESYYLEGRVQRRAYKNYEAALVSYYNSIRLFEKMSEEEGVAKCFRGISLCHLSSYNYALSFKGFSRELSLRKKQKKPKNITRSLYNIGLSLLGATHYDSAIRYFNRSLLLANSNDMESISMRANINIGNCFLEMNKLDSAVKYLNKSILLADNDNYHKAIIYRNMGAVSLELKEYKQAIDYYHKTLSFPSYLSDVRHAVYVYSDLGDLHFMTGNKDSAMFYYRKVTSLDQKEVNPILMKTSLKRLKDYFYENKDYEASHEYSLRIDKLSEPLDSVVAKQDSLFKSFLTERIHIQNENNLLEKQRVSAQKDLKYTVLLCILIVLLLIIVIYYVLLPFYKKQFYKKIKGLYHTLNRMKERDRMLSVVVNDFDLDFKILVKMFNKANVRKKFKEEDFI